MIYDAAWFLGTAIGKKYESITDDDYFLALLLAQNDARIIKVEKYCPALFETALALQIDLILQGLFDEGGVANADGGGEHIAYVTSDKVYDVQRNYTLMQKAQETLRTTPSGRLATIYDQCKGAKIAMHLARTPKRCGCAALLDTMSMYSDHINTYFNHEKS